MQQAFPGVPDDISLWKGQDISNFQEEMRIRVNGQISEKWFYMHMKSSTGKLPRVDVLDLLSRYAGYQGWNEFKYQQGDQKDLATVTNSGNRMFILVPLLMLAVMGLFYGMFQWFNTREYRIRFYDASTLLPILETPIEVVLLDDQETPVTLFSDSTGELSFETKQSFVRLIVRSPYYSSDTIQRILKKFRNLEQVPLKPNDYALMMRYLSQPGNRGWQERRARLDSLIAADALIYRVHGTSGIELVEKEDFIDFLSIPSASLKQLEILEILDDKRNIRILRYRIKETEQ